MIQSSRFVKSLLVTLLAAAPAAYCSASAQTVPDEVSCPKCSITSRLVTTVGDLDGRGVLNIPSNIKVDGRGRYFLYDQTAPKVFDSTGRFIGEIGKPGAGPGELTGNALPVPVAGDSILVFQPQIRKAVLFGPDFRFARQIQLPGFMGVGVSIRHWPDSIVFLAWVPSREHFGLTLHSTTLSESTARITHSGGPEFSEPPFNKPDWFVLIDHGTKSGETLWSAKTADYELTRWDTQLRATQTLVRRPKWWTKTGSSFGSPTVPPSHGIIGLTQDKAGLLWVFIRAPRESWRDAWATAKRGVEGGILMGSIELEKLASTLVEVIDPIAGKVIARAELDDFVLNVLPGPRAAAHATAKDGSPQVRIIELQLVRR